MFTAVIWGAAMSALGVGVTLAGWIDLPWPVATAPLWTLPTLVCLDRWRRR